MEPRPPVPRGTCRVCRRTDVRLAAVSRNLDFHWADPAADPGVLCTGWGQQPDPDPDGTSDDRADVGADQPRTLDDVFAPYGYAIDGPTADPVRNRGT